MEEPKSKATLNTEQTVIHEGKSGEIRDQSIADDVESGLHLPNLLDTLVFQTPVSVSKGSSD